MFWPIFAGFLAGFLEVLTTPLPEGSSEPVSASTALSAGARLADELDDQSASARSVPVDWTADGWVGGDLVDVSLADMRMAAADWTSVRSAAADLDKADRATVDLSSPKSGNTHPVGVEPADPIHHQPADTMAEYYQLQQELLVTTLVLSGLLFPCVWFAYTQNIALNYLLGACTGVVYLKLLARNVERLGSGSASPGKSHLAVFGGVMIVATQWNSLHVLPVFLGFLTFKLTLLIYTLRILLKPGVDA